MHERGCKRLGVQKIFVIFMKHDLLSDTLSAIKNGDNFGKRETITHASKLVKEVLLLMQKHDFIGNFEHVDDKKGGKFKIQLTGSVNNCGAIKPRFPVSVDGFSKYEKRFLPAEGFGFLIVSTSQGLMTHSDAKQKGLGGKLLAYVY
jgi:small subunit ribosomal protein S8